MGSLTPALRGHIAMLFFSAFVAGSFSLGSQIANEIEPLAVTTFRFGAGAAILGLLALVQGGMKLTDFAAPWRYMLLGNLFAVYFVLMFAGLQTSTPVAASAIFTLIPLLAAVYAWMLLRQFTSMWSAVALSIGAVGALMVVFRSDVAALVSFELGRGEIIYFLGCISHAIYTPMLRRLNRGENAVVFTFGMQVAGFIALMIYSHSIMWNIDWAGLGPETWAILAYLSVFSTAISFVLLQFASVRLPASNVMAYTYLTPTWVIGWELAIGNQLPPDAVFFGIGLTIVALLMLLRSDLGQKAPAPGASDTSTAGKDPLKAGATPAPRPVVPALVDVAMDARDEQMATLILEDDQRVVDLPVVDLPSAKAQTLTVVEPKEPEPNLEPAESPPLPDVNKTDEEGTAEPVLVTKPTEVVVKFETAETFETCGTGEATQADVSAETLQNAVDNAQTDNATDAGEAKQGTSEHEGVDQKTTADSEKDDKIMPARVKKKPKPKPKPEAEITIVSPKEELAEKLRQPLLTEEEDAEILDEIKRRLSG